MPGVALPRAAPGNEDVWHLYVVRVAERDRVLAELERGGIGAGIHYPTPVHLTGAYADLGLGAGSFPVAERAAGGILSLPMFPHITEAQQQYVADRLQAAPWAQKRRRRPRQGPGARHEQPGADRLDRRHKLGRRRRNRQTHGRVTGQVPPRSVGGPSHPRDAENGGPFAGSPGIRGADGPAGLERVSDSILRLRVTVLPGVTRPGIRRLTALLLERASTSALSRTGWEPDAVVVAMPLARFPKDAGNQDPVPDRRLA